MEGSAVLSRSVAAGVRRRPVRAPFVQRYWAFLSYSHQDEKIAGWLHRALETFRVPKALVGRRAERFLVPARLTPIFRDRSELAAADDLSEEIEQALECSRHLIVLCSPAAAKSHWVDEEIRTFRRLRPDGEVLAVIVAGEPWASRLTDRGAEECFPLALREQLDENGQPTGEAAEPIAVDLRPGRDGRARGLLKIVAGMLDLRLDELVQRDEVHRHRRMVGISAASIAGMLAATGLAVSAVQARDEARHQRREAESLVGFMIGDLTDKLDSAGSLHALDAVGARVLAYYEKQDEGDLSDEALAQRSKALTMIGETAQRRGNLDGALGRYRAAMASTSELLRRNPESPRRIYDHAQNLFYFGKVAWQRGRADQAAQSFRTYKQLAERMIALEPERPDWRLEGVYADTLLGLVLLANDRFNDAETLFARSLPVIERLAAADPGNTDYQYQLLETLAYLSDAQLEAGRLTEAIASRERSLALIDRFAAANVGDRELRLKEMVARAALARLALMTGEIRKAASNATAATGIAQELTRADPDNTEWAERAARSYFRAADVFVAEGQPASASASVDTGCRIVDRLVARDPSVTEWSGTWRRRCLLLRASIALGQGSPGTAATLARAALANAQASLQQQARERRDAMQARLIAGDALRRLSQRAEALAQWRAGLADARPLHMLAVEEQALRAVLLRRLGDSAQANAYDRQLGAIGFRHPAYAKAMQQEG
jgi:tetratricopeptide (TPR) repeat protein